MNTFARAGSIGKGQTGWVVRLTLFVMLLSLAGCASESPQPLNVRHVVVISFDTTRADHFGFLGNQTVSTPRMDAMAAESIVFSNYMTVVPTTLASHTTLFTGKYPHRHGTPRNGFMVNMANEMLAEILGQAGFHTTGFIGSFALESRFDFAQGFNHYDEDFSVLVGNEGADQNQRSAAEVTNAVIEYLNEMGVPERLFLFAHFFDPHRPYAPPAPYDAMYDPKGPADRPTIDAIMQNPELTVAQKQSLLRRHELANAGEISYMDEHVGRLFDYLERSQILDDALVVITSDHGENFTEHPMFFNHGFSLFQTTMRGVCLFRLPKGIHGDTRVEDLIASIDVFPTILSVLGLEPPATIDGVSVNLTAAGDGLAPRTRFGQATRPKSQETGSGWANIRKARCIREGNYKLIEIPYLGREGLYDLEADPGEMTNLLHNATPEAAALAARLRAMLNEWAESARPLASDFEQQQLDETLERLRSLGYID
jgi:arylsulfatase A-like enzyme